MTDDEVGDPAWSDRVHVALSRVDVRPRARLGRPALLAVVAATFAVAACLVPIPRPVPGPDTRVQQAAIERAEERLATLEEEVRLDPVTARELHESLERLSTAAGDAPIESTFEALDRASRRLEDEARARGEAAVSASEALAAAAADAAEDPAAAQAALEETLRSLEEAGLTRGLEGLEGLQLAGDPGAPSVSLPAGTKLDAAQLAQLARTLDARLGEKLARLAASGLLRPNAAARAGRPGEIPEHVCSSSCRGGACRGTGRTGDGAGQGEGDSGLASGTGAGSGGVSRGPGAAPLSWGDESNGDTSRFRSEALPPGAYRDPSNSIVASIGAAAPDVDPIAEGAGDAAVRGATGSAAWKRRLAPHHRDAVQSFFSREEPK